MMHDDFEQDLRRGLATLAREAIPDERAAVIDELPRVQTLRVPARPRRTRLLAAAIVIVLAVGLGVIALVGHGSRPPHVETRQPSWTKTALFPLLARSEQAAVFTGRDVIVWGGRSESVGHVAPATVPPDALADGAAYDLRTGSWGVLPTAPIGSRYGAVAAWTGREMLVVGGRRDGTGPSGSIEFLRDGAAYDPAHRRWQRIPDAPGCPEFGTWTGRELVVGGTCANTTHAFVMAEYDPARNVWTTLPSYAAATQLVTAGGRVYAWNLESRGAVLDPARRKWTSLPALPVPGAAYRPDSLAVAYNGHLAVAGLLQRPSEDPARDHASVDILDLGGPTWRHYESATVVPAIQGDEIAAAGDALGWTDGLDFNWFVGPSATGAVQWSSVGREPVELGSTGEALVPIGGRRLFIWGGLLASSGNEPNRPTSEGALLQLP